MNEIEPGLTNQQAASQLDDEVQRELDKALGDKSMDQLLAETAQHPAQAEDADDLDGAADPAADEPKRVVQELKRGRISSIQGDDVFVELAGLDAKMQGVVPLAQFDRPPRKGSIMDFVVERIDDAEGVMHLSREGVATKAAWEHLARGAVVEARVVATNKGGLELEMLGSIKAFMPASQIDLHHVDDMEQFVGQKITALVHDIDRKGRKVVISRRHYLEQQKERLKRRIWSQLEEGKNVEGKVSSIVEYGAFVDLGGVDGLLHISDMSHSRIGKPGDIVQVGQTITVRILKLEREKERIRLGLKQAMPDPWDGVEGRFKAGDQVTGKVVRLADFGAFIEIEAGIEGLLPVSEMSWRRIHKPGEVVKEGDTLRLGVLHVDPEKRRISLSLKSVKGDPWVGAEHKYAKNSLVEATVRSTTDFGAFVEIEQGVEGLVHISELSPQRVDRVEDVLKVGDRKQFRVLDIDEEERKVRLSLKAVEHPVEERKPSAGGGGGASSRAQLDLPKRKHVPAGKKLKGGIE